MTLDSLGITSNDYVDIKDNPFYDKKIESLTVNYTIEFDESAAKNGWDGIFSFYNSTTGGRVSFQTAPYICYNEATGNWMDIKALDGADMYANNQMKKGVEYQVCLKVDQTSAHFYVDGTEVEVTVTGSVDEMGYLLDYIAECDQFSWGVGQATTSYWWTEICKIKDVKLAINDAEKEDEEETEEETKEETEESQETNDSEIEVVFSTGQSSKWVSGTYSMTNATIEANKLRIRMTEPLNVESGKNYSAVIMEGDNHIQSFRMFVRDVDQNGKVKTINLSDGDVFTAEEGHSYYVTTQNYWGNVKGLNFQKYVEMMTVNENKLLFDFVKTE